MTADPWVQPHPFDDLATIQAMGLGIGIQLIEIGDPHGKIGIGEQFDRFSFRAVGQEERHTLLDGPPLQEGGETLCPLGTLAHYDARRMQIVIKSPSFSQKLW
ncbi:hypothetical protein D3C72_1586520 [compost metagenome]